MVTSGFGIACVASLAPGTRCPSSLDVVSIAPSSNHVQQPCGLEPGSNAMKVDGGAGTGKTSQPLVTGRLRSVLPRFATGSSVAAPHRLPERNSIPDPLRGSGGASP